MKFIVKQGLKILTCKLKNEQPWKEKDNGNTSKNKTTLCLQQALLFITATLANTIQFSTDYITIPKELNNLGRGCGGGERNQ